MNDPWYQPRFVTCIAVILLMAAFVALNTWETDKGVFRVYLDEGEKLCVAYRGKARGWPQTYSVRYVLDEERTTLLGYPKRKFMDDEYDARPLWINVLAGFIAFGTCTIVLESTVRLIALRPKKVREEPRRRMVSEIMPTRQEEPVAQPVARAPSGPSSTKAAIVGPSATKAAISARPASAKGVVAGAGAGAARPVTAKLGAKAPGRPLTSTQKAKLARPASIKQKPKVEEPKPRPASVKPALAARRQDELRKLVKT